MSCLSPLLTRGVFSVFTMTIVNVRFSCYLLYMGSRISFADYIHLSSLKPLCPFAEEPMARSRWILFHCDRELYHKELSSQNDQEELPCRQQVCRKCHAAGKRQEVGTPSTCTSRPHVDSSARDDGADPCTARRREGHQHLCQRSGYIGRCAYQD